MAKSKMGRPVIDLTGLEFGRLKVIRRSLKDRGKGETHAYWECECSCGKIIDVRGMRLKNGRTKSCGCLRHDTKSGLTHGKTGSKEYMAWSAMRQRCLHKEHKAFKNYGGRGITICKRWDSFENFLKDMGKAPEGHTLERLNNNRGYSKKNCIWATYKEQARNRRSNVYVSYKGKKMLLVEMAELAGITTATASIWNKKFNGVIP